MTEPFFSFLRFNSRFSIWFRCLVYLQFVIWFEKFKRYPRLKINYFYSHLILNSSYLFILRLFYYIFAMQKTHKNGLGLITFQRKLSIQLLLGVEVKEQERNCFEKWPWERQMNEEVQTETKPTGQTCDFKSFAIAGFRFLWMVARDFYALLYRNKKKKQKLKSGNQDLNSFTFRLSAFSMRWAVQLSYRVWLKCGT